MVLKILLANVELARTGNRESSGNVLAYFLGQLKILQGPVPILDLFCEKAFGLPMLLTLLFLKKENFPTSEVRRALKYCTVDPKTVYWTQACRKALSAGAGRIIELFFPGSLTEACGSSRKRAG